MSKRDFLGYLALSFLAVAFAAGIYYVGFAPQVFRIAVPNINSEPAQLFSAMASALKRDRSRVRLVIVPYETNEAIVSALEAGQVDLAIARTDRPLPRGSLGVAEVQEMITLVLARPDAGISSYADLKGKKVGEITRSPPGLGVFAELSAFNQLKASDIEIEAIRSPQVLAAAITEHKLDALLLVAPRGARQVGEAMRTLTQAFGGEPKVVPLKEAKAVATRLPAMEAAEIAAGELSATPQIPAEAAGTITFPVLLQVRKNVASADVQELTKQIFNIRNALTAQYPAAARLAALDTERGAAFAVHPGAAIYYDASETTLLDKYSDMLWLVLFGFSTIVSAFVWFLRRLFPQQREMLRSDHSELVAMLQDLRTTTRVSDLNLAETRIDEIVSRLSKLSFNGRIDEEQQPAFELIIQRIEKVIEEKRQSLEGR